MSDATHRRLTIALARAEEDLIETHVQNVIDIHEAVGGDLPLEDLLDLYFEELDPGDRRAAIIARRVLAQLESAPRPQRPRRRWTED